MKRFILFLTISLIFIPANSFATKPEEVSKKKEILIYSPVWTDVDDVPQYIQDNFAKILFETPKDSNWKFLKIGFTTLILKSTFKREETNYYYKFKVTDDKGNSAFELKTKCEICTFNEAKEKLVEFKKSLIKRLNKSEKEMEAELLKKKKLENEKKLKALAILKAKKEKERIKKLLTPKIVYKFKEPKQFIIPEWEPPEHKPYKIWTVSAMAAGLIAITLGLTFIIMDNDPTCDESYPDRRCSEVYATGLAGWTLLATGLGVGGWGGYTFYKKYIESEKPSITPKIIPTGKGVVFSWKF
jgi:hypothetical protein